MTLYELGLPSTRKQVVLKPLPRAIQCPAHRQGCCHPIQCRPVGLGLQSFVLITVQLVINIIRCWGELKSLRPQSVGDRGAMSLLRTSHAYNQQNRPLLSFKNPHFQNEAKCTIFLVKMSFICMRIKNHFHIKDWALTLVLKQRRGGTRKG